MAWAFGDSFDLYTGQNDPVGYWDVAGAVTGTIGWLNPGRFPGGRALQIYGGAGSLYKTSGANDTVHHFNVAYMQGSNASPGATNPGFYFQLIDGATNQCCVVFRQDGAIVLLSGNQLGTVLATYPNAFIQQYVWYAFEIEVIVNNTTGRFRVRRNGNPVDDFDSGAVLNTRGGTANNYANKILVSLNNTFGGNQNIDDFFWRSDPSSVPWIGDMRCVARAPGSNVSTQFTAAGVPTQTTGGYYTNSGGSGVYYMQFTPSYSGSITGVTFNLASAITGHIKVAIYDTAGTSAPNYPGNVIGTVSSIVTNPVQGANTVTFSPPISVTKGQIYWLAFSCDTSFNFQAPQSNAGMLAMVNSSIAYATFPLPNPTGTFNTGYSVLNISIFYTVTNYACVGEPQQDGLASYVSDSTPGDADFYGLAPMSSAAQSVIAVTTRGFMIKSDAGTRTAAVQVKSGSTTAASPTLVLTTSGWQWAWRTDMTDPNTGATWTPAAVESINIGPRVVA